MRLVLCLLLLLWIFHCIFVNEARIGRSPEEWARLSRMEQWQQGWSNGPSRLAHTVWHAQAGWMALSLVYMGITLLLGVMRWRMALRVQGFTLSFGRAAEISLVAQFFNAFLLGSTGGDLIKAYYAAREHPRRKTDAVVTVFVDRLIGLWSMLIFTGVMMIPNAKVLFASRGQALGCLLVLGMLAVGSVMAILAFWGGVSNRWSGARQWLRKLPAGARLEKSLESCRRFGREPFFVMRAVLVSMALNVVCVLQWQAVGRALGLEIDPLLLFAVVPLVICVAALPITPSGLGVRENLFLIMLNNAATATPALTLSLLAYAGFLAWSLVGGAVYLLLKDKHHLTGSELTKSVED